jgi:hypothetical protein
MTAFSILVLLVLSAGVLEAAAVRGRLDHPAGSSGTQPRAGGIAVTVYNQRTGRSAPSYTGADGIYFIRNLAPGSYYLEIWTSRDSRVRPTVYPIKVAEPLTDIAPIVVPNQ